MFKPLVIASAFAAVIVGAVSMASANNTRYSAHDAVAETAVDAKTGIVNCTDQVWPAIDSYCLEPASDLGEMRQARLISL